MRFTEIRKRKRKRRGSKRCRFERHHKPSSSPGHAENREEEAFSLPFFYPFSVSQNPKKPTPRLVPSLTPPRPHAKRAIPCRVQRQGRLCSSRPPMLPPCPAMRRQGRVALTPSAYKYRGSAGQKEEEKRRKERESWKYFCFEERGGKLRERNRLGRERDDRN